MTKTAKKNQKRKEKQQEGTAKLFNSGASAAIAGMHRLKVSSPEAAAAPASAEATSVSGIDEEMLREKQIRALKKKVSSVGIGITAKPVCSSLLTLCCLDVSDPGTNPGVLLLSCLHGRIVPCDTF